MSKEWKIALIVVGALVAIGLLVGAGVIIGRNVLNRWSDNRFSMMGRGGYVPNLSDRNYSRSPLYGQGNIGPGMMGRSGTRQGMMGRLWSNTYNGTPLTIESAKTAVKNYLTTLNNEDLYIKEIMVFNNNVYAVIAETSTGKGAMELLVDPATLNVSPEIGPNMMWNTKYGHMINSICRRGQQGFNGTCANNQVGAAVVTDNVVTTEQALQYAQTFLDENVKGATVADDAIEFYGYLSLDYIIDGKPAGMLSVNGFTGQVWLHTWHGTFIEEWEAE